MAARREGAHAFTVGCGSVLAAVGGVVAWEAAGLRRERRERDEGR